MVEQLATLKAQLLELGHRVLDSAWRTIERVHEAVEDLRAHRLFPNRKIFNGLVVSGLTAAARWVLAKTGVDLGPWVIPAAGVISAYLFTDGPRVKHLDEEAHDAIDTEERVDREAQARKVANRD